MSSEFGHSIKVQIFGQSHSKGIGVVIDGLPTGEKIDIEQLFSFMKRRAPGNSKYTTPRSEKDVPIILSGLIENVTCGAPLCALIENNDTRSSDYDKIKDVPRPSHSDYPAYIKYNGFNDVRGGGHFSGRLTAPLCFAGGICLQLLERKGIVIASHIKSIGKAFDISFDPVNIDAKALKQIADKEFPVISAEAEAEMKKEIEEASLNMDSVGGVIECAVLNFPAGIGEPMFDGIENRLSAALFGIPAVKGIEFGLGFESAKKRGSQNNDAFYYDGDTVKTKTNNHGGILGGISTGMPIIFRAAIKPTSSIGIEQDSISLSAQTNTKLKIQGRHDPCIAVRAVPCIEAVTALVLMDFLV